MTNDNPNILEEPKELNISDKQVGPTRWDLPKTKSKVKKNESYGDFVPQDVELNDPMQVETSVRKEQENSNLKKYVQSVAPFDELIQQDMNYIADKIEGEKRERERYEQVYNKLTEYQKLESDLAHFDDPGGQAEFTDKDYLPESQKQYSNLKSEKLKEEWTLRKNKLADEIYDLTKQENKIDLRKPTKWDEWTGDVRANFWTDVAQGMLDFDKMTTKGKFWEGTENLAFDTGYRTVGAIGRGFNSVIGGMMQGIAIGGHYLDEKLGTIEGQKPLEEGYTYRLGTFLKELGTVSTVKPSFFGSIFEGVGSSLGFMIGAIGAPEIQAANSLKWGSQGLTFLKNLFSQSGRIAISGGLAQYPDSYMDALKMTGDRMTAMKVGVSEFVGGMSEAFPLATFLEKAFLGKFSKAVLKEMLIQGLEEGTQEAGQQLWSNLTAQEFYDVNKKLSEGVVMGGITGLISGMLMVKGQHSFNKIIENKQLKKDLNALIQNSFSIAMDLAEKTANPILNEFLKHAENTIAKSTENLRNVKKKEVRKKIDEHVKVVNETLGSVNDQIQLSNKIDKSTHIDKVREQMMNTDQIIGINPTTTSDGKPIITIEEYRQAKNDMIYKMSDNEIMFTVESNADFAQQFKEQNAAKEEAYILFNSISEGKSFEIEGRKIVNTSEVNTYESLKEPVVVLKDKILLNEEKLRDNWENEKEEYPNFLQYISEKIAEVLPMKTEKVETTNFISEQLVFNKEGNAKQQYYEGDIKPEPNTIFVFGSNPEGRHGAGAALTAKTKFGAKYGQGEGLQGNSYALPTKDLRITKNSGFKSISPEQITTNIKKLYEVAKQNPNKQFKIGYKNTNVRSLNGYTGIEMIDMFNKAGDAPSNIIFSKEWFDTGKLNKRTSQESTQLPTTVKDLVQELQNDKTVGRNINSLLKDLVEHVDNLGEVEFVDDVPTDNSFQLRGSYPTLVDTQNSKIKQLFKDAIIARMEHADNLDYEEYTLTEPVVVFDESEVTDPMEEFRIYQHIKESELSNRVLIKSYDPNKEAITSFIDRTVPPKKDFAPRKNNPLKNEQDLIDYFVPKYFFLPNVLYPLIKTLMPNQSDRYKKYIHLSLHSFNPHVHDLKTNISDYPNLSDRVEVFLDDLMNAITEKNSDLRNQIQSTVKIIQKNNEQIKYYLDHLKEGFVDADNSPIDIKKYIGQTSKENRKWKKQINRFSKDLSYLNYWQTLLESSEVKSHLNYYFHSEFDRKNKFLKKVGDAKVKFLENPDEALERMYEDELYKQSKYYVRDAYEFVQARIWILERDTDGETKEHKKTRIEQIEQWKKFLTFIDGKYRKQWVHGGRTPFANFDWKFIRSGEGATVYGYGHYLTTSYSVGHGYYAKNMKQRYGTGVVISAVPFKNKPNPNLINLDYGLSFQQANQLLEFDRKNKDEVRKSKNSEWDYLISHARGVGVFNPEDLADKNKVLNNLDLLLQDLDEFDKSFEDKKTEFIKNKNLSEIYEELKNYVDTHIPDGINTTHQLRPSFYANMPISYLRDYARSHATGDALAFSNDIAPVITEMKEIVQEYVPPMNASINHFSTESTTLLLKKAGFDGTVYRTNSNNENFNLVVFDDNDIEVLQDKTYVFKKGWGSYDFVNNDIKISSALKGNELAETLAHEVLHKHSVYGIIGEYSAFHNKKLYSETYKNKIKALYEVSKEFLPKEISELKEIKDQFGSIVISEEDHKLVEFIAYGLTNKDLREQLTKVPFGKTGKSTWRHFVDTMWEFVQKILNIKDPNKYAESAFYNLLEATSSYIDANYSKQKAEVKSQVKSNAIQEIIKPAKIEVITKSNRVITFSEIDAKAESMKEEDLEARAVKTMKSSSLTKMFTDNQGNQIWNSPELMLKDMAELRKQATETNKDMVETTMLKLFEEKYKDRIDDLEAKDKEYLHYNLMTYMQNVFYIAKSQTKHQVMTFSLDKASNTIVNKHLTSYPKANGGDSSVIYRKRFYENISAHVSKALGKKVNVFEIKNYSDYFDSIKRRNKEYEQQVKDEKSSGEEIHPDKRLYEASDSSFQAAYRQGIVVLTNKTEELGIEISSILTQEEINEKRRLAFEYAKEKSELDFEDDSPKNRIQVKREVELHEIDFIREAVFNKYWRAVFGNEISKEVLFKRMAQLTGESANSLITPYAMNNLSTDDTKYMYRKGEQIMIKTVELDSDDLPNDIKKHLKETIGEFWYKDGVLGDGAMFTLPEVHNMHNIINGNPMEKWGICNKTKTWMPGEQLLKCADQQVYEWMPLHNYMRENNIARIVINTARKIRKSSIGKISFDDIRIKDANGKHQMVPKSAIYEYDMRNDADMASHGEVKKEAKGLMSAWLTTMLTEKMTPDQQKSLLNHFNSHNKRLEGSTLDWIHFPGFIRQKIYDFMDQPDKDYESVTEQYLNEILPLDVANVLTPQAINFYKQNVLNREIQNTLEHKESNANSPVLLADLGKLTGYKEFMTKQNPENAKYFDEKGFIKENAIILDTLSSQKIGKPKEVIGACNPPSSFADMRALDVAGILPNKRFNATVEGERIERTICTSGCIVNIKQWQLMSGKDFDIDKINVLSAKDSEVKKMFNFIREQKADEKLTNMLKQFEEFNKSEGYYLTAENNPTALKNMIKVVSNSKKDRGLMHVYKIFGAENTIDNFDTENPQTLKKLLSMVKDNHIGRLYNVRMMYSAILDVLKDKEYMEFKSNIKNSGKYEFRLSTKKEDKNFNTGLLYWLTNYTLDWMSDQRLLSFNYDVNRLMDVMYQIEYRVQGQSDWTNVKTNSPTVVDWKGNVKILSQSKIIQDLYETHLKPSRMLLRKPDNEDESVKKFAELKAQMTDGFKSLYGETKNSRGEYTLHDKSNPFNDSFVIKMTRDFFKSYTSSFVGAIGLQPEDITFIQGKLKAKYALDAESSQWVRQDNGKPLDKGKLIISDFHYLSSMFNRYQNITSYTPIVAETRRLGMNDTFKNSGSALREIQLFGNKLKREGKFESMQKMFGDLLSDMFSLSKYEIRKQRTYNIVKFHTLGKNFRRTFEIQVLDQGNRVQFRYQDVELGDKNQFKNKGTQKSFDSFDEMEKQCIKEGYDIRDAMQNMDDGVNGIGALISSFTFRGNSSLKEYTKELTPILYSRLATDPDFLALSDKQQKTFFQMSLGVYDIDTKHLVGLGQRYNLGFYEGAESITNKKGQNIQYLNLSPALMSLQRAGKFNPIAQTVHDEVVDLYKTQFDLKFNQRLASIQSNKSENLYFFKVADDTEILNNSIPIEPPVSNLRNNKEKQEAINNLGRDLSIKFPDFFKPFQIIDYWNLAHPAFKIYYKDLEGRNKQVYLERYIIGLAESFFNFKYTFDTKVVKSYKSKKGIGKKIEYTTLEDKTKKYDVILEAHRLVESALDEYNKSYIAPSRGAINFLPAHHAIGRFSSRNLTQIPNSMIKIKVMGKDINLTTHSILSQYGIQPIYGEPLNLSGAMICHQIMARTNYMYQDLENDYDNSIAKASLDVMMQVEEQFADSRNIKQNKSFMAGLKIAALASDIAEGIDEFKTLKGIQVQEDGTISRIVNREKQVWQIATVDNNERGKIKWDLDKLGQLSRIIAGSKSITVNGVVTQDNLVKGAYTRAIMNALIRRYVYDFYILNQLEHHKNDLIKMAEPLVGYSDMTNFALKSAIVGPNGILDGVEKTIEQIKGRKKEQKRTGTFYVPHYYDNQEFYRLDLEDAIYDDKIQALRKSGQPFTQADKDKARAEAIKESTEQVEQDKIPDTLPLSSSTAVKFKPRNLPNGTRYVKTLTTFHTYLKKFNFGLRVDTFNALENLYPEFLQYDNEFMQHRIMQISAMNKTQNAFYKFVKDYKQLKKNSFISFHFNDKSFYTDVKGVKDMFGKYRPEQVNKADYGATLFGEVLDVLPNGLKIRLTSGIGANKVETFTVFEMKDLKVYTPMNKTASVNMDNYRNGKPLINESARETATRLLVSLRNMALLGGRPFQGMRNLLTNASQLSSMYSTGTWYKAMQKVHAIQTIKQGKTYEDAVRDMTEEDKQLWNMVTRESSALFGQVNEIMGRMGVATSLAKEYMTKEELEILNKMHIEFEAKKQEYEPLAEFINGQKSDVNLAEHWYESTKLIRLFFVDGAFKHFFWDKFKLDQFPLGLLKALEVYRAPNSETTNRMKTAFATAIEYADMLSLAGMTKVDAEKLAPAFKEIMDSLITQGIGQIDYGYQQGQHLSYYDSFMPVHFLLQFSHFPNMFTNNFWDTCKEIPKQFKMFGATAIYKRRLGYVAAFMDPATGNIVYKEFHQLSDARRAIDQIWKGVFVSLINTFKKIGGYGFKAWLGSTAFTAIFDVLFLRPLTGSASFPLTDAMTFAFRTILGAMGAEKLAAEVASITMAVFGGDPPDEKEIAKYIDKGIIPSQEYYVEREMKKERQKHRENDLVAYNYKSKEFYEAEYKYMIANEFWRTMPIGVGMQDLADLVLGLVLTYDKSMKELNAWSIAMSSMGSVLQTTVPLFYMTTPFVKAITGVGNFIYDDPFIQKRLKEEAQYDEVHQLIKDNEKKKEKEKDKIVEQRTNGDYKTYEDFKKSLKDTTTSEYKASKDAYHSLSSMIDSLTAYDEVTESKDIIRGLENYNRANIAIPEQPIATRGNKIVSPEEQEKMNELDRNLEIDKAKQDSAQAKKDAIQDSIINVKDSLDDIKFKKMDSIDVAKEEQLKDSLIGKKATKVE